MRTKTVYVCEVCGCEYALSKSAFNCEAQCLGLTPDEYKEYLDLLEKEKRAFSEASCTNNEETRNKCDMAVKAVLAFQEKHGLAAKR